VRLAQRSFAVLSASILAVAFAAPAGAQDAPKFFADGIAYAGLERYDHSTSESFRESGFDPSGTVGGGTVAVGTFLSDRVSVRFEASFETGLEFPTSRVLPAYSTLITALPPNSGLSPTIYFPVDIDEEQRRRTFATMIAFHQGRGKARVAYLAGLAIVNTEHRTTYSRDITPLLPLISTLPVGYFDSDFKNTHYSTAPALGVDVEIAVGRHVHLLPELRAIASEGVISIRPGIGLRWIP
jgi:hypothetical protein